MNLYKQIIRIIIINLKNKKMMKYCKPDLYKKMNKFFRNEITQFNLRLFKINEKNKEMNLNKLSYDKKKISLSVTNKNSSRENNIKTIFDYKTKKRNNNILHTLNKFSEIVSHKSVKNKNNNYSQRIDYINKNNTKLNNFINLKLCLVPISYHQKNKSNKKEKTPKFYCRKKFYNKTINKFFDKNILDNDFFRNKKTETEEDDMKPKTRFVNLKRDLLDEKLKINKMFINFQKQLLENKKLLK